MKINHRPEVDGLRTIVVFTVIFYYAKIVLFDNYLFAKKRCEIPMPDNSKIHYDYGHYAIGASKYFVKKINQINWLKLD